MSSTPTVRQVEQTQARLGLVPPPPPPAVYSSSTEDEESSGEEAEAEVEVKEPEEEEEEEEELEPATPARHLVSDLHKLLVESGRSKAAELTGETLDKALQTLEESPWAIEQDNVRRMQSWGFASVDEVSGALARQQISLNQLLDRTRGSEAKALARVDLLRQQLKEQEARHQRACAEFELNRQAKTHQLISIAEQLRERERRVASLEHNLREKKRQVRELHARARGAGLAAMSPFEPCSERGSLDGYSLTAAGVKSISGSRIGGVASAFTAVAADEPPGPDPRPGPEVGDEPVLGLGGGPPSLPASQPSTETSELW